MQGARKHAALEQPCLQSHGWPAVHVNVPLSALLLAYCQLLYSQPATKDREIGKTDNEACCACVQVIAQRLSKLGTFKKSGAPERQPAEVLIKRRKRGRNGEVSWEIVRARGHLDEVLEMRKGGSKLGECGGDYDVLMFILLQHMAAGWASFACETYDTACGKLHFQLELLGGSREQC